MKKTGLSFIFLNFLLFPLWGQSNKALTVQDLMRFKRIEDVVISEKGDWIAYGVEADRGDGEGVVRATSGDVRYRVPRGTKPSISKLGQWVSFVEEPAALEKEKADGNKKKLKKLKPGMLLVNTINGKTWRWDGVKSHAISNNDLWLARLEHESEEEDEDSTDKSPKKKPKHLGSTLVLRNLAAGVDYEITYVTQFAFDPLSRMFVYARSLPEGKNNGLYYRDLTGQADIAVTLFEEDHSLYPHLAWDRGGVTLAVVKGFFSEDIKEKDRPHSLNIWWAAQSRMHRAEDVPDGWTVAGKNKLRWSLDGQRLFFGLKPMRPESQWPEKEDSEADPDLFDIERLRDKRTLEVWHGQDPLIKPQEKKNWKKEQDRTYTAVFHTRNSRVVPLADKEVPEIRISESANGLLASSDLAYRRERTWAGFFNDYYAIDLQNGKRTLIGKRLARRPNLSPSGRYAVFFRDGHIHLFDVRREKTTNLTAELGVPFANEDHDYPSDAPGYGFGGWVKDDQSVLVYDKYDIWVLPVRSRKKAYRMTGGDGRDRQVTYRLIRLDEERQYWPPGEKLLLSAYYELAKNHGFYLAEIGKEYVDKRMEGLKRFRFVAKAKEADVLIYTREDFSEFPDLWTTDSGMNRPRRLTNENPQISEFAWGEPELVEWNSLEGVPHQGILIRPSNVPAGQKVPVLVYFYRFFSQRMYHFNQMTVNHRPNFPFYTSNGYAVFLPDIRFEVETPGLSSVKSLLPGVQKIIEMGVADPDAIGLHGHSWSGYQTAFIVTQTNMFKAAVSGAPVSNMTSAYSGIRLGTGLARQFQYETGQSRIGHSMWERRDLYIENSPVFFADRIETPLLIQFGDIDDAVPWEQGIELYLAMRRLDKDVVFLQYNDEPHHLKKFPNRLDYTLKMKEFFDHYLKGEPAPTWLTEGEPYRGNEKND